MNSYQSKFSNFLTQQETNKEKKTVLIFDGLNLFLRSFQAVPVMNDNGDHIGGFLGFYRSLKKLLIDYNPDKVVIVFDGKGGSMRRRKIYKEYKDKRISAGTFNRFSDFKGQINETDSLKVQIANLVTFLECLPVHTVIIDGIEADDCIAYSVQSYLDTLFTEPVRKVIVSSDKDFIHLIDENTDVYSHSTKCLVNESNVKEIFGYLPKNYLTLRCFTGDRSDNINGAKNVGPKGLNKHFNLDGDQEVTVQEIVDRSKEEVASKSKLKLFSNIVNSEEIILRNYQLMQLLDVDISGQLKSQIRSNLESAPPSLNLVCMQQLFSEYGLNKEIGDLLAWKSIFERLK
jgi:DNA polymerase-1